MGKNLQVTSFHFEAERPTFGHLRTQKKKSCRATVYFLVQRALWSLEEVRKEGVEVHMTTEVIQKALMYHGGKSWKLAVGLGSWGNVRTLCFLKRNVLKVFLGCLLFFLPKFPEVCGEMICWVEAMNF